MSLITVVTRASRASSSSSCCSISSSRGVATDVGSYCEAVVPGRLMMWKFSYNTSIQLLRRRRTTASTTTAKQLLRRFNSTTQTPPLKQASPSSNTILQPRVVARNAFMEQKNYVLSKNNPKKSSPASVAARNKKQKIDEKPWPKYIVYGTYIVGTVFIPYMTCWFLSMNTRLRELVFGNSMMTEEPSAEGEKSITKLLNWMRRHYGQLDLNVLSEPERVEAAGVEGGKYYYKFVDEPTYTIRQRQSALERDLEERTIPVRFYNNDNNNETIGSSSFSSGTTNDNRVHVVIPIPAKTLARPDAIHQAIKQQNNNNADASSSSSQNYSMTVAMDFPDEEEKESVPQDDDSATTIIAAESIEESSMDSSSVISMDDDSQEDMKAAAAEISTAPLRSLAIYSSWYYQQPNNMATTNKNNNTDNKNNNTSSSSSSSTRMTDREMELSRLNHDIGLLQNELKQGGGRSIDDIQDELSKLQMQRRKLQKWRHFLPW